MVASNKRRVGLKLDELIYSRFYTKWKLRNPASNGAGGLKSDQLPLNAVKSYLYSPVKFGIG
jgi:hypothetical protein